MFKQIFKNLARKPAQHSPRKAASDAAAPIKKAELHVVAQSQPKEISRLFISTVLGEEPSRQQHSNSLDQSLLLYVRQELSSPDIDSIPKLAQASLNLMQLLVNDQIGADELVKIIEEDPVLLGKVLEMANSSFYRTSTSEITDLSHAVVLMGNTGLKRLVMNTLVSEKLKVSSIYFKVYGANIWKHCHDVAIMSAAYAKANGASEFRAYLNGLLHDVGKLVIFKVLIQAMQEEAPDTQPTASFFAKVIEHYGHKLTLSVLGEWSLDPELIKPILRYQSRITLDDMDTDTRALYIANWCSEIQFLHQSQRLTEEQTIQCLHNKGIDYEVYKELICKVERSSMA